MTRNLKALGVALVAAFAMSAVVASAASATTTDKFFVTGGGTASIHATKVAGTTTIFGIKNAPLEVFCETETFTGTAANEATSITITPTYGGCTAEPFGPAPVHMNGCTYKLTNTTTSVNNTNGQSPVFESTVDIICPANVGITITAPGCDITVTGSSNNLNQNLHGLRYDNEGTGSTEDIKVTATVDNIHYESPGGFICSLGGVATTGTNAFLTGSATAKGTKAGSSVGIGITDVS